MTADLQLHDAYFFTPSAPPIRGTLQQGSRIFVDWRKGSAAYISCATVVRNADLDRIWVAATAGETTAP